MAESSGRWWSFPYPTSHIPQSIKGAFCGSQNRHRAWKKNKPMEKSMLVDLLYVVYLLKEHSRTRKKMRIRLGHLLAIMGLIDLRPKKQRGQADWYFLDSAQGWKSSTKMFYGSKGKASACMHTETSPFSNRQALNYTHPCTDKSWLRISTYYYYYFLQH